MKRDHSKRHSVFRGPANSASMRLNVCPTTGGKLELSVSPADTVEGLKRAISRKLRVHEQRLNLLHKNRILVRGSLQENHLSDGSHVTLLPNLATGTATNMAPTDSRVMQALENLSDTQVNDFLTGRAPLLLAMKMGEHMMFVQLQLSTSSCHRRRPTHPATPGSPQSRPPSPTAGHQPGHHCGPPPPPSPHSLNTSGAMIDRVSNLGHGVYSGSFSGTLDSTVQNRDGKPKRDISTILHILNDLLIASPQIRQHEPHMQQHVNHSRQAGSSPYSALGQPSLLQSKMEEGQSSQSEDVTLRGKVRHLQDMMAQRRMQRRSRRGMKASPYHWTQKLATIKNDRRNPLVNFEQTLSRDSVPKSEGPASPDTAPFSGSSSAAIEQETVLV